MGKINRITEVENLYYHKSDTGTFTHEQLVLSGYWGIKKKIEYLEEHPEKAKFLEITRIKLKIWFDNYKRNREAQINENPKYHLGIPRFFRNIKKKLLRKLKNFLMYELRMSDDDWVSENFCQAMLWEREENYEKSEGGKTIKLIMETYSSIMFELDEEDLEGIDTIILKKSDSCSPSKVYIRQIPKDKTINLKVESSLDGCEIYGPMKLKSEGIYVITIIKDKVEVQEYKTLTIIEKEHRTIELDDDEKI